MISSASVKTIILVSIMTIDTYMYMKGTDVQLKQISPLQSNLTNQDYINELII